jgi:hypothetical protein
VPVPEYLDPIDGSGWRVAILSAVLVDADDLLM